MSTIVLIPAAGSGTRMGASINKQYLQLADRPILAHTVHLFEQHPAVDEIFIISPSQEIDFCWTEVVKRFNFVKVRDVVTGGAERQDSVRNGLLNCNGQSGDIVVIHDGVRPFFPSQLLETVISTAQQDGACLVAVPAKDTIKEVRNGQVTGTPERQLLWQAQTPQAFRFELIFEAHQRALQQGVRATDDTALVEWLGAPVTVVKGSYRNIKITTPEDLVLAEAFYRCPEKEAI